MTLEREHAILTEQNGKLRAEVRRLGAELATSRALHLTEQARVSAGESWDKRKVRRQTREVNRLTRALRRYLACWCHPDQPCHADVLLELANGADQ